MAKAKAPVSSSDQEKTAARSALKVAKFKELANARVNAALDRMDSIRKLSNRNAYTYDQAQVTALLNALKKAVNEVEAAFTSTGSTAGSRFSL